MNLQVSPDAPPILHLATAALLAAHISGGAVGIVSGFGAMAFRKGGRLHRLSGNVFFIAMLTMAGIGGAVAPFLPSQQWSNTLAGVFTVYLLATGWMSVRRGQGEAARFEMGAMVVALGAAAAGITGVWVNAHGGADAGDSASTDGLYLVSVLATVAAAGDLNLLLRKGLRGPARLARHLWRLSFALLIASASFFLGQPKFVPPFIRDSFLVAIPVLAPLALMAFWLIRVRLSGRQPRPARPLRLGPQAAST